VGKERETDRERVTETGREIGLRWKRVRAGSRESEYLLQLFQNFLCVGWGKVFLEYFPHQLPSMGSAGLGCSIRRHSVHWLHHQVQFGVVPDTVVRQSVLICRGGGVGETIRNSQRDSHWVPALETRHTASPPSPCAAGPRAL